MSNQPVRRRPYRASERVPSVQTLRLIVLSGLLLALPGCNLFTRLSEIGRAPDLSRIEDPQASPSYQPVSLPMPAPMPAERNPNSLWRQGARSFFKDQRAAQVGDILTVLVKINDSARIENETERTRNANENAGLPNFLGLENQLPTGPLWSGANPSSLVSANSTTSTTGDGSIEREEQIELRIAAIIIQVLPNGNLVLQGSQEVRINFEVRELTISGVIRPEDISARNEINYDKIAEARISYGGRGQITDVQQPRWGQQVYDVIWPW